MSLPDRLKSPNSVIQFLDSVDGKILVEYFQEMRDKSVRMLRSTSDLTLLKVGYAQGAADAAEKVCDLKKDILQYLDDVRTGKIPPKAVGEKKV